MTVDARRPSPVDPVDLGVDRQESSELFGDMGDFGDLLDVWMRASEHLRVERRILDLELARVGAAHRLRWY